MVSPSLIIVERLGMLVSRFTQSYHCGEVHKVISSNLIIVEKFFGSH